MELERRQELLEKLRQMQNLSNMFYDISRSIQVHTYIEFTGFLNEYIQLCRCALEKDIDFTETSAHNSQRELPIEEYQAAYIGEKFGCVFKRWLANPEILRAFLKGAELRAVPT